MGNSDSKLEEIESLRQQKALNQAQIAQLQHDMNLQRQQQEREQNKKSNPIKDPQKKSDTNSKEYNNYAKQNIL